MASAGGSHFCILIYKSAVSSSIELTAWKIVMAYIALSIFEYSPSLYSLYNVSGGTLLHGEIVATIAHFLEKYGTMAPKLLYHRPCVISAPKYVDFKISAVSSKMHGAPDTYIDLRGGMASILKSKI